MHLMTLWETARTPLTFLFVLGVLVFVHELGHFLVARWYGVRVITFSLGFGPKILKYQAGPTEYCVSAVPLGGYVKLAGETVEDDDRTGGPDEFLSKSKWVRFQVYLAGPIMNLLLAWIVLAAVLSRGADVPLADTSAVVIGSIDAASPAEQAGLQVGDRIVSVGGRDVPTWDALNLEVLPKANQQLQVVVDRHGTRETLQLTPSAVGKFEIGTIGIHPVLRPQVREVTPNGPADRAGMRRGDVLLATNGQPGLDREAIVKILQASAGKPVQFSIERDGQPMDLQVTPESSGGVGIIGVAIYPYEVRRVDPTLGQAFVLSAQENWESTVLIGRTIAGLFKRETPVRQLMGPLAIAQLSGEAARVSFIQVLNLMSMISLNLGLLNLLPVPVLDGGHIAILAVEGVARRDLSVRVKERVLIAGAALIVLLMVTVIYNDVMRLIR